MTDSASTQQTPHEFSPTAPARDPHIHQYQGRSVYCYPESESILQRLGFLEGKPAFVACDQLPGRTQHPVYAIPESGRFMWKSCLRGGFLSRFNRKTYFSIGRFVSELILSDRLHRTGIPSSKLLAFSATRTGLGFEVTQLVQLENDVISISDMLQMEKRPPTREQIRCTGALIHRFHHAGFLHGDLNLMNIMINADPNTPARSVLVDLDPGSIPPGSDSTGNLARLARSYAKIIKKGGTPLAMGDRYRFLYQATGGDRRLLKKALEQCTPMLPETERVR